LSDEIRILTDERLKRLAVLLEGKALTADLHDEKTNKRLITKGTELTRDIIEKIATRNLKRLRPCRIKILCSSRKSTRSRR
jgi:DNA-directed RNA polymerase subunit beta